MSTGRYHWSNGARSPRLFVIHSLACVPLLGLILHPSWKSLYALLGTIVFVVWVEKIKKMTLRSFWRSINIELTGRVKPSVNLLKELSR